MLRRMLEPFSRKARTWVTRAVDPHHGMRVEDSEFAHRDILDRVQPFTMTSTARVMALADAVEYVVRAGVPGDFVECGVWRGGSMMVVALVLLRLGVSDRDLWLYDTFEGMARPSENDRDRTGRMAADKFDVRRTGEDSSDWCRATIDEVRANILSTGYAADRIHLVKGKVEETIPTAAPPRIALLRLDTDWYASTLHELKHLYPRLEPGGVLLLDDYGHWQGARKAVDEYFLESDAPLLLSRIDVTGRMAVKRS